MNEEEPQQPASKAFDLLASAASFARNKRIALNDPALVDRFLADARPQLAKALADKNLIHGSRTERLFETTVLTLGRYRMLKIEDIGRVHSAAKLRAPDFRVVLEDGTQWLVEVKNVRCKEPLKQRTSMTAAYLGSLRSYADMVGAPLKIALYWSLWNIWTIISPEPFLRPNGGLRISMTDAITANEFGKLGETMIATRPPIRLVLDPDISKPRLLGPGDEAKFTVGAARLFSGDTELTDRRDLKLAEVLFLYGDWLVAGPFARMEGGELAGVEYVAEPQELTEDQDFQGIGWASRIFSRFYATRTIDGDQVIQLHGEAAPDWFEPLGSWDFKTSNLPLLLGHIQPNDGSGQTEPDSD